MMPPKKKGKKGKKKSGKKSGSKSGKISANKKMDKMNDTSKDYYLIQVKDLEKRILKMQKRCDELDVMNQQLDGNFSHLNSDCIDICAYLKESVLQKGDEIATLSEEIIELQRQRDSEKDSYEQKLAHLEASVHETKESLTSENMILSGKLSSMEEFKIQKENLMEKFAAMEQEIAMIEAKNKDVLYHMERDAVVDKDRLRKEMMERVNGVAAEFRKVSNKQMAETTKRTITENVQVNSRLQKLSEKTMILIAENDKLRADEKQLKRQTAILSEVEREFMRKSNGNQKTISFLVEQCRENEDNLIEYESPEHQDHLKALKEENDLLQEDLRQYTSDTENHIQQRQHLMDKVVQFKEEARESKRFLRKLNRLINDTKMAVLDAQGLLGNDDDEVTEAELIEKRQRMLQSFLVMLNSASVLGIGIDPADIGTQSSLWEYRTTSSKTTTGTIPAVPSTTPAKTPNKEEDVIRKVGGFIDEPISADKLAKFGLQPVPATHLRGRKSSELLRGLSATTRLGRRTIPTTTTGIQVGSTKTLLRTEKLVDAGQLPVVKEFHSMRTRGEKAGEYRTVPTNIF